MFGEDIGVMETKFWTMFIDVQQDLSKAWSALRIWTLSQSLDTSILRALLVYVHS